MNRCSWIAGEVRAYGLYGARVQAWVAPRRGSYGGVRLFSTAPDGRERGGLPGVGSAYVHGRNGTAMFFGEFAGAVEDACEGRGVVDVVSDYGGPPTEVGVHDDAWTPSHLHVPHPAADLLAKLAARGGPRMAAIRLWCRTVSSTAGPEHERRTKSSVLCILGMQQAKLLAETARRFAEM